MGYITNFIVYTLAMVGIVVVALFVFKHSTNIGTKKSSQNLKVLDTLSIGPRKTLYIVSAGEEKFLIAGDVDRTSLISKLNTKSKQEEKQIQNNIATEVEDFSNLTFQETMKKIPSTKQYMDRSIVGIHSTQKTPYKSVMRNLAEKIKG